MIEKNVTAANADEKIKQLYETAFPEDEQIPSVRTCLNTGTFRNNGLLRRQARQ